MVAALQRTQPIPGRRLGPLVPALQPSVCFWKARGHKGAWAPRNEGLTGDRDQLSQDPLSRDQLRTGPADRKGVGSRPQRHLALLCQGVGVLEAEAPPRWQEPGHADTVSHTSLGRGACAGLLSRWLSALPRRQFPELLSQALLYGASLDEPGLPLWGGPSSMGASSTVMIAFLYWWALLYRDLPLWGGAFSLGGLPLWGPPHWGGSAFLYGGLLCGVGLALGPSSQR